MRILHCVFLGLVLVKVLAQGNQAGSGSETASAGEEAAADNSPGSGIPQPDAASEGLGGLYEETPGEGQAGSNQIPRAGGPSEILGQGPSPTDAPGPTEAPDEEEEVTSDTTEGASTAAACSGSVVSTILGPQVFAGPYEPTLYNAKNGGPVAEEQMLDCDFESDCCWKNALPPEDTLDFSLVKGPTDELFSENFGVDAPPEGSYAVAGSSCPEAPEAEALFVSCTIPCTNEPVTVTLSHWTTENVKLEVCIRHAFFNNPETPKLHCVPLEKGNSHGPSTVEMPPGEVFDIVIAASNFIGELGDMAIIDDIIVEYTLCPRDTMPTMSTETPTTPKADDSTTTTGGTEPTEPTESTTADTSGECEAFVCDFEEHACNYKLELEREEVRTLFRGPKPDLALGKALSFLAKFRIYKGRFQNYVTGIYEAAEGEGYLATYLTKKKMSGILSKFPLSEPRVLRFKYYSATQGIEFTGCCHMSGGEPICKNLVSPDTPVLPDFREWKTAQMVCPAGTERVGFECSTLFTDLQGACGIDYITLHVYNEDEYDENDPDKPLESACPDFGY